MDEWSIFGPSINMDGFNCHYTCLLLLLFLGLYTSVGSNNLLNSGTTASSTDCVGILGVYMEVQIKYTQIKT